MKTKEIYISILDAGENIGFSASSSLAKGTNKSPLPYKKIVGTNQIEKIEITCLIKTAAKLLVFSDISKLISNF